MQIARLAVLGSSIVFLSAAAPAPQESFCERLAPKLGMKEGTVRQQGREVREWKINMLGGLGPVLFGGSTVVTFQVASTVENPTYEDQVRLNRACENSKKGIICRLQGPAVLTLGTSKGEIVEEVLPMEHPVVEMRKTSILCRNTHVAE